MGHRRINTNILIYICLNSCFADLQFATCSLLAMSSFKGVSLDGTGSNDCIWGYAPNNWPSGESGQDLERLSPRRRRRRERDTRDVEGLGNGDGVYPSSSTRKSGGIVVSSPSGLRAGRALAENDFSAF